MLELQMHEAKMLKQQGKSQLLVIELPGFLLFLKTPFSHNRRLIN